MNIANLKSITAKTLTLGFLAGAIALVAPVQANAQEGYFGGYGYAQNDYARHEFFERERARAFYRHEEFVRHQAWLREREFRHYEHERRDHDRYYGDRFGYYR